MRPHSRDLATQGGGLTAPSHSFIPSLLVHGWVREYLQGTHFVPGPGLSLGTQRCTDMVPLLPHQDTGNTHTHVKELQLRTVKKANQRCD